MNVIYENEPLLIGGREVQVVGSLPIDAEADDSTLADIHAEHLDAPLTARAPAKLTPTQKRRARTLIRNYCERAIDTAASKHYSQHRAMTHLGKSPEREWTADCSGFDTGAFRWADEWCPFEVQDPNGLGYSGWGYTGTLLSRNIGHRIPAGHRYLVGDMSLYGPASRTRHTTICFRSGTAATALWASHGSEAGPYPTRLHYRSDFLCVVRGRSLL